MTVTVNMAAAMRLENPCRLSNFGGSGLGKKKISGCQTNIWITTDAAKSTTNTPVIGLGDQLYSTSEEDAP